uniref:RalA-binding protein 1 n=1 Tax=Elaeophora elaphi TaxID=1147741 RepID=A0A0R3S778_9BILA
MQAHESKPVISEPILIEKERKEEWKRKRVKIIRQMLEEERRHVESLRETSVEGIQLERALQRIESLQNQLRNMEPVVTQIQDLKRCNPILPEGSLRHFSMRKMMRVAQIYLLL